MPVEDEAFLNDVVVGPDGAAYVTDSVPPGIFRVAREHGGRQATVWADAADAIEQKGLFGLNGIEDTGDVLLTEADGLVVRGRTLVAVRNRPHVLTYLRLEPDARSAEFLAEVDTDPDRVFTTADVVDGRLLLVDSQFDEDPPSPNSEVVVLSFRR